MATITIPRSQIADVRTGDVIVAIDGHPTRRQLTVQAPYTRLAYGAHGVRLVNPLGTATEWVLYPDTQVEENITVERRDVAPATPMVPAAAPAPVAPKPQRRTKHGLTLVGGAGYWVTQDGRYVVQINDGYLTFCDEAHPVRFTPKLRAEVLRRPHLYPDAVFPASTGARGYRCPGGAEHSYERAVIHDNEVGDYPVWSEGSGGYDGVDDAWAALAAHLA